MKRIQNIPKRIIAKYDELNAIAWEIRFKTRRHRCVLDIVHESVVRNYSVSLIFQGHCASISLVDPVDNVF